MIFQATKAIVPVRVSASLTGPVTDPLLNRGTAPDEFLEILVHWAVMAEDAIFAPNPLNDIYALVWGELGPFDEASPAGAAIPWLRRRAAMLEILRVLGGLESSWTWTEGADPDDPDKSPVCQETGIFQVSANSMSFDPSLPQCVLEYCGANDTQTFINQMKQKWCFAVEYCARLLRFDTEWDGPIDRGVLQQWVRRDSMAEFETLILAAAQSQSDASACTGK